MTTASPPPESPRPESKRENPPVSPPPAMEQVLHGLGRKKGNSAKVNATISLIFHSILILLVFFLAAREGMLGKKMKAITATLVPKEKKPEPPKKAEEPKPEPPKEVAKAAPTPKPVSTEPPKTTAPPPSTAVAPPVVAPPTVGGPGFEFTDGAKNVITSSDPHVLYKGMIENALRSRWNKPDDIDDDSFIAEVKVRVDPTGKLVHYDWMKGSGNKRWDESVRQAMAATKAVSKAPPKGFPDEFTVRFDVEAARAEPLSTGGLR